MRCSAATNRPIAVRRADVAQARFGRTPVYKTTTNNRDDETEALCVWCAEHEDDVTAGITAFRDALQTAWRQAIIMPRDGQTLAAYLQQNMAANRAETTVADVSARLRTTKNTLNRKLKRNADKDAADDAAQQRATDELKQTADERAGFDCSAHTQPATRKMLVVRMMDACRLTVNQLCMLLAVMQIYWRGHSDMRALAMPSTVIEYEP